MITDYRQSVFNRDHSDKHLSEFLPTRWRHPMHCVRWNAVSWVIATERALLFPFRHAVVGAVPRHNDAPPACPLSWSYCRPLALGDRTETHRTSTDTLHTRSASPAHRTARTSRLNHRINVTAAHAFYRIVFDRHIRLAYTRPAVRRE